MKPDEIFAKTERATELIDLALGNEFEADTFFAIQKILLVLAEDIVREAKAEAYEESEKAAYKVAATYGTVDVLREKRTAHQVATEICGLKDSLAQETVSSGV